VIRIAAVGDLHFGIDSAGTLRSRLTHVHERADVLLLAGDLTRLGDPEEARVLAEELADVSIPTVAVLGNHDHHSDRQDEVAAIVRDAGVTVVEGDAATIDVGGTRVGIAGTKGFGGGFAGASGSDFGEREMKVFIRHTMELCERLEAALRELDADTRVALMHYAPIQETLEGEPPPIFPFLGSYLLAEAVDHAGADLVVHGHAHRGRERGTTPGGIPVRNVAWPVIRRAYAVYELDGIRSG
jgi:Icc-related predicted phosphoesterase